VDQKVNEIVDGKSVASTTQNSRKVWVGYDVRIVRETVKLINFVDRTNEDFIDFGVKIVSKFFAWLAGVKIIEKEKNKGQIYVSNDLDFEFVN